MTNDELTPVFWAMREKIGKLCDVHIEPGSPDHDLMIAYSEITNKIIVETGSDVTLRYPRQEMDYFISKRFDLSGNATKS